MPVKNAGLYLHQCIDSMLHQSFRNWELLAVDDGSTDESNRILSAFEDKDLRVRVLNNPESGIVAALAHAFQNSTGKFVTRMDADDVMPVKKLETLYKALQGKQKTVVTGKVKYFGDKKISEGYLRYEKWLNDVVEENHFERDLFRECVVASPNWMVDRKCFEQDIRIDDLSYPEDYDMVFNWIKCGYKIEGLPKMTHMWREHPERTSRHSIHYQQKAFFDLKTNWFIHFFKNEVEHVQLIGKGEKGKLIAAVLNQQNIPFKWFDLQPSKQQSSVMELEDTLTILSNWPKDEKTQNDITEFLRRKNLKFGENLWLF